MGLKLLKQMKRRAGLEIEKELKVQEGLFQMPWKSVATAYCGVRSGIQITDSKITSSIFYQFSIPILASTVLFSHFFIIPF